MHIPIIFFVKVQSVRYRVWHGQSSECSIDTATVHFIMLKSTVSVCKRKILDGIHNLKS